MAVTHFEIIKLPNKLFIESYKGVLPLEENVLYPIEEQDELSFKRVDLLGSNNVVGQVKYKSHNDSTDSLKNTGTIHLKWKSSDQSVPTSSDSSSILERGVPEDILFHIPISDNTDFIEITEVTPGLIESVLDFSVGRKILVQDLIISYFKIPEEALSTPFGFFKYKVGNEFGLSEVFTFTANVSEMSYIGELESLGSVIRPNDYNYDDGVIGYEGLEVTYKVQIKNGIPNASTSIQVDIDSNFFDLNIWNRVSFISTGSDIKVFDDGTTEINPNLDNNGNLELTIVFRVIKENDYLAQASMSLKLLEIDNTDSGISKFNNTIIINVAD